MEIEVFVSLAGLSFAAAKAISDLASNAISKRGLFTVALSGGSTPRTLFEILASDYQSAIDWAHVHLFWGDERFVPLDDPASNFRMAKEMLIDRILIPVGNVHPIDTSLAVPQKAADDYSELLLSAIGGPMPSFDLMLLGLGNDGHTASLFPGMNFESIAGRLVVVTSSPKPPAVRISLTLDVINAARNVFFLVSGTEKGKIFREVLDNRGNKQPRFPASMVNPKGNLLWFVDQAASNEINY